MIDTSALPETPRYRVDPGENGGDLVLRVRFSDGAAVYRRSLMAMRATLFVGAFVPFLPLHLQWSSVAAEMYMAFVLVGLSLGVVGLPGSASAASW